jgi:GAF domain-containing protein
VSNENRNRRLRLLISRLNKERKKQARQIDILCNDLIAAQKDFIKELNVIGFAAEFYESILGAADLNELLYTAGNLIKNQIRDVNAAFFLLQPASSGESDGFEMHIFESDQPIDLAILCPNRTWEVEDNQDRRIENFFTTELVEAIARSNRLCTVDDMLVMGLAGNPRSLEKVSAVGLPLNHHGCSLGFLLLYRASTSPFTSEELKAVGQIAPGLARAITSCLALVNTG